MQSKYSVILADPPWQFRAWSKPTPLGRTAESYYPTLSTKEIAALPIGDIAEDNCALFLWACWPTLPDALEVIREWGFEYKTIAWIWVKLNRSGQGYFTGMGHYTRANTEPCLLAIRGRMPVAWRDVLALIVSPVQQHSSKPKEQYEKIERLYPGARCLELFARSVQPGWRVWGNEVRSHVDIPSRRRARHGDVDGEILPAGDRRRAR